MRGSTEIRKLIRKATRAGCVVRFTGRNHIAIRTPSGATVYASGSPSDWRAIRKVVATLRRIGGVDLRSA